MSACVTEGGAVYTGRRPARRARPRGGDDEPAVARRRGAAEGPPRRERRRRRAPLRRAASQRPAHGMGRQSARTAWPWRQAQRQRRVAVGADANRPAGQQALPARRGRDDAHARAVRGRRLWRGAQRGRAARHRGEGRQHHTRRLRRGPRAQGRSLPRGGGGRRDVRRRRQRRRRRRRRPTAKEAWFAVSKQYLKDPHALVTLQTLSRLLGRRRAPAKQRPSAEQQQLLQLAGALARRRGAPPSSPRRSRTWSGRRPCARCSTSSRRRAEGRRGPTLGSSTGARREADASVAAAAGAAAVDAEGGHAGARGGARGGGGGAPAPAAAPAPGCDWAARGEPVDASAPRRPAAAAVSAVQDRQPWRPRVCHAGRGRRQEIAAAPANAGAAGHPSGRPPRRRRPPRPPRPSRPRRPPPLCWRGGRAAAAAAAPSTIR